MQFEGFVISSCEKTIHTIHHKLIINKQISGSALVSVTSLINLLISGHQYVKHAVNITSMSVCVFRLQGVLRAVCGQSALGLSHSYDPPLHGCGLVLWVWPRGSERHRHHPAELLWSHQSSRGDAWCLHYVSSYLRCSHIKWCHLLVFYLSLQAGKLWSDVRGGECRKHNCDWQTECNINVFLQTRYYCINCKSWVRMSNWWSPVAQL